MSDQPKLDDLDDLETEDKKTKEERASFGASRHSLPTREEVKQKIQEQNDHSIDH